LGEGLHLAILGIGKSTGSSAAIPGPQPWPGHLYIPITAQEGPYREARLKLMLQGVKEPHREVQTYKVRGPSAPMSPDPQGAISQSAQTHHEPHQLIYWHNQPRSSRSQLPCLPHPIATSTNPSKYKEFDENHRKSVPRGGKGLKSYISIKVFFKSHPCNPPRENRSLLCSMSERYQESLLTDLWDGEL
jgi:hypothetical protein